MKGAVPYAARLWLFRQRPRRLCPVHDCLPPQPERRRARGRREWRLLFPFAGRAGGAGRHRGRRDQLIKRCTEKALLPLQKQSFLLRRGGDAGDGHGDVVDGDG